MSDDDDPLGPIGRRIEILSTDPERVRARWTRLVRPILRAVGWQPAFEVKAIGALIEALRGGKGPRGDASALVRAALEELDANVASAERACVVNGHVPTARAAWLRRLYEVGARATRAAREGASDVQRRMAAAVDPVMLLPPLALAASDDKSERAGEEAEGEGHSGQAAMVELQLASIDLLLDAARVEGEFLGRRRRLFESARKLLLDTSAALPLDPAGVEARRRHIAEQIVRLDRLEAAGIAPEVGLLHQARSALSRGDRQKLHAAVAALDMIALGRGDLATAKQTSKAIRRLWGGRDPAGEAACASSIERSAAELLGEDVLGRIRAGYEAGRADFSARSEEKQKEQPYVQQYMASEGEPATLSAALAVDGCFEVGGPLSPVRVTEYETRVRAVSYPTPDLVLLPAHDMTDVPGAILEDPRSILLSLAEGRLLTRKFIRTETVATHRIQLSGEIRVYLLDGSGSMLGGGTGRGMGARARMRDAILLAELATLHRRYTLQGGRARVALYYRYFDTELGPITRVDSAGGALDAIVDVLRTAREGGTNIESALIASFQQVREARDADPDLARAQIVLVTDGEAPVRPEVIRGEREKVGDLPVGVSVIALGEENKSLRELVAWQRARGERAFYHHLDDAALRAIVGGSVDRGPAIHLDAIPSDDRDKRPTEIATELEKQLGGLLDELGALDRKRHTDAMDAAGAEAQALAEVGLDRASLSEGERARRELLDRDRQALDARFARWFPAPSDPPRPGDVVTEALMPAAGDREVLDRITIALSTVAEVVGDLGGSPLGRRADAIEIFERLLPDARLSPARYHATVKAYPGEVRRALAAVHDAVKEPG